MLDKQSDFKVFCDYLVTIQKHEYVFCYVVNYLINENYDYVIRRRYDLLF